MQYRKPNGASKSRFRQKSLMTGHLDRGRISGCWGTVAHAAGSERWWRQCVCAWCGLSHPARSGVHCRRDGASGRSRTTKPRHGWEYGAAARDPRHRHHAGAATAARVPAGCRDHRSRAEQRNAGRAGRDRSRQGPGQRTDADRGRFRSRGRAQSVGRLGARAARRRVGRPDRQSIPARSQLSRLRRFAGYRHAAGARRLSERRAHQRGVRRHRQLGFHPGERHQPADARSQQSDIRAQRHRRCPLLRDEERIHLSRRRGRRDRRLVWAGRRLGAGRRPGRKPVRLHYRRRHQ